MTASGKFYKSVLLVVLTLALLLGAWALFHTDEDEVVLTAPVRFERIPAHLIPLVNTPPVLEVRLRGPSKMIQNAKDLQLLCRVDLSGSQSGSFLVRVTPEMIEVPRRVSILHIEPASFNITIDKSSEKTVPVVPHLNQDPGAGYVIARVAATPSTVILTGPAGVLEEISAVRTTPIDVAGLTETTRKRVALALNRQPYLQPVGESLVEVEIVVEPKITEKRLSLPVQAEGGTKAYVISPDRIEILLRGPLNVLKSLTEDKGVRAYVDLSGLEPGTYVRPVVIKPPLDITLVEAKPEAFTVKVLKKDRPREPSE